MPLQSATASSAASRHERLPSDHAQTKPIRADRLRRTLRHPVPPHLTRRHRTPSITTHPVHSIPPPSPLHPSLASSPGHTASTLYLPAPPRPTPPHLVAAAGIRGGGERAVGVGDRAGRCAARGYGDGGDFCDRSSEGSRGGAGDGEKQGRSVDADADVDVEGVGLVMEWACGGGLAGGGWRVEGADGADSAWWDAWSGGMARSGMCGTGLPQATSGLLPLRHSARLHSARLHPTRLHSTRLRSTRLRSTRLHPTRLHSTRLHSARLRSTRLHSARLQEPEGKAVSIAGARETEAESLDDMAKCVQCSRLGAHLWSPPGAAAASAGGSTSAGAVADGNACNLGSVEARMLCCICSAEAEIEARAPLNVSHARAEHS